MALTREERAKIQEMSKRIRNLESQVEDLQLLTNSMQDMLNALDAETNMSDWTQEQWAAFLRPFIGQFVNTGAAIPKHTHENDEQGGPAFAKLGATLVE